ncbi:hypothetical protein HQN89_04965 [Paenibacillus frigoriresistens]|nr:hypothetical protein [Paenibacillus frigoriresistens]
MTSRMDIASSHLMIKIAWILGKKVIDFFSVLLWSPAIGVKFCWSSQENIIKIGG